MSYIFSGCLCDVALNEGDETKNKDSLSFSFVVFVLQMTINQASPLLAKHIFHT